MSAMQDIRVRFGLRECATDSEASWDGESDFSGFPSDSEADSFIEELGDDYVEGEFEWHAGEIGENGHVSEGIRKVALPGSGSGSGSENREVENVDGHDREARRGIDGTVRGRRYGRNAGRGPGARRDESNNNGEDLDGVFDRLASQGKESWSEIDERARLAENTGGNPPTGGRRAGAGQGSKGERRRRGNRRRKGKRQQGHMRSDSTPGGPHSREAFVDVNGIQQWPHKPKPHPSRSSKSKQQSEKKILARRLGRGDPPLTGAVVRPFTLPAGPITILKRPPQLPTPQDTSLENGSPNAVGIAAHSPALSPDSPNLPVQSQGLNPVLTLSCSESPPASLRTGSQDSFGAHDVVLQQGNKLNEGNGSHVVHVTTKYGPGIVVENPKVEIKEFQEGVESSDGETEERIKAAREAAETAMVGLSMGKDGKEEGEVEGPWLAPPRPSRKSTVKNVSAESYDRCYYGSVDTTGYMEGKGSKGGKRRGRGKGRNRGKNGTYGRSQSVGSAPLVEKPAPSDIQPKFLLTRANQGGVGGSSGDCEAGGE